MGLLTYGSIVLEWLHFREISGVIAKYMVFRKDDGRFSERHCSRTIS